MTDPEFRQRAFTIEDQIKDTHAADETIISQIKELPELLNAKLRTGMNPFMAAVNCGRIFLAKALCEMGADIQWACAAGKGNALNIAGSPEQADEVLGMGVRIEKDLLPSKPFINPAIAAADRNDKTMLFYWLAKQEEIFAEDEEYIAELLFAAVKTAAAVNQPDTLAGILADDSLFPVLKDVYSNVDHMRSIQLYLTSLRRIDDPALDGRKKELRKILNGRKAELSSTT